MNLVESLMLRNSIIKPHRRGFEILTRITGISSPHGAELGVYKGLLSRVLLKHKTDLNLLMIDSWEGEGAGYAGESGDAKIGMCQNEMNACLEGTARKTDFASDRRKIMRMRTDNAALEIEDGSLDFCFIDADHSYEGCKSDIEHYRPKIKSGGWLCGHDYDHPKYPMFGVKRAVDEFADASGAAVELGRNYTWFIKVAA